MNTDKITSAVVAGVVSLGVSLSAPTLNSEKVTVMDVEGIEMMFQEQKRVEEVTGKYTEISASGFKSEIVFDDLKIKPGIEVFPYNTLNGDGFQLITHTATQTISIGYGPEANERTWTKDIIKK